MADAIENLRRYLHTHGTGKRDELAGMLSVAWPEFDGSDEEAMAPHKIARIEDPEWEPPYLGFVIERHGGTALGSTRAELQRWTVSLDEGTAVHQHLSYRQLKPRRASLDVRPLAQEIASAVNGGMDDPRLRWYEGGKIVQPIIARILPDDGGPKQTFEGRKRRLKEALRLELANCGWQQSSHAGRYERKAIEDRDQ